MRLVPALLPLALLAAAAPVLGEGRPAILRDIGFDQRLGETISLDLPFRDEAGRAVSLGDYFGERPVVLTLNYYGCPMLCTVSLNGLASALDTLSFTAGREFEVVTVSFDASESPQLAAAKKETYLKRYKRPGAERGWHFLTGDQAAIDRLTAAVGFRYARDPVTGQFAHPAGVMVLTPRGVMARYLYGIEYSPKDLRFALVEASEGRIGNPVDQIVLACYQYDPATGRYGAAIMRILRIGGALTLGALVTFVAVMLRRDGAAKRSGVRGEAS
jgi:protein SCO1/2